MGLAPYGTPRLLDDLGCLVKLDRPLFELGLDYFLHDKEGVEMTWDEGSPTVGRIYSDRLCDLLGPARERGAPLEALHKDVAASLQVLLEMAYLHLVKTLWERTGIPRLCLAGGVALNRSEEHTSELQSH